MNPLLFDRMLCGINAYYPKLCVYKERLVYHIASTVPVRNSQVHFEVGLTNGLVGQIRSHEPQNGLTYNKSYR